MPRLTFPLRVEPAHREAYVDLGSGGQISPAQCHSRNAPAPRAGQTPHLPIAQSTCSIDTGYFLGLRCRCR